MSLVFAGYNNTTLRNEIALTYNQSQEQYFSVRGLDNWCGRTRNMTIILKTQDKPVELQKLGFNAYKPGMYNLTVVLQLLDVEEPVYAQFKRSGQYFTTSSFEHITVSNNSKKGLFLWPNSRYSVSLLCEEELLVRLSTSPEFKYGPFTLELPKYSNLYGSPVLGVWYKTLTKF